jgi:hypothetical protein
VTGEATPAYLFDVSVPYKLRATFPHARLIALIREPAERAYSRWKHLVGLKCAEAAAAAAAAAAEGERERERERWCTSAGINEVFDRVAAMQLPALRMCIADSGVAQTAAELAAESSAVAHARYEALTQCMHRRNSALIAEQMGRLDEAAAVLMNDVPRLTVVRPPPRRPTE